MTLITFQSRIHFASDVLEEALRAELEESQHRKVLLVADADKVNRQMMERVQIGMPDSVWRDMVWVNGEHTKYDTAALALGHDSEGPLDAIVACGSARAIAHGRKCRHAVAQARHAELSEKDRRVKRARSFLPDFFAIPGVDGLPDPCMASGATAGEKTMPPNVIICDPSILAGSKHADVANAFAISLGRCLATFGGSSFNPLADGMAVEGLRRLAMTLPLLPDDGLMSTKSRDLMAASLNGSISQQKGPGLVQAIADALTRLTHGDVDSGSLQRILLPRLLRDLKLISGTEEALVMRVLDTGSNTPLSESVERMLDPLPLNRSLREMGYALADVQRAVSDARARVHVPDPVARRLNTIVEEVY
ncbi:iron-containing alcohol dehydrogenase [Yoonia sp. SS1-5]|uniref:Iron-containing alcohol dehydrogenase n=1 Tax=Yoonia rhodophyticola TaxID=3137370 RepID=A0AAN0NIY6_9RHOB